MVKKMILALTVLCAANSTFAEVYKHFNVATGEISYSNYPPAKSFSTTAARTTFPTEAPKSLVRQSNYSALQTSEVNYYANETAYNRGQTMSPADLEKEERNRMKKEKKLAGMTNALYNNNSSDGAAQYPKTATNDMPVPSPRKNLSKTSYSFSSTASLGEHFPRIESSVQKERDNERHRILVDELRTEERTMKEAQEKNAASDTLQRHRNNIAALEREIARFK